MIDKESNLDSSKRMDIVSIVTPNHIHFDPAYKALNNGFPVIIDKPMTYDSEQAKNLVDKVNETGIPFAVTHTYTGYPMVKEAKSIIKLGKIGKIRKVAVEYPQGWLTTNLESTDNKQASWRTDPSKSGKAGSMGDIGTHAANMVEYVTGKKIIKLLSKVNVFVEGRLLEDDGNVLITLEDGIEGNLMTSQIATGEENDLKIRVWGDSGGIEWKHSSPNTLLLKLLANCRTPSGHPEGFIEAFANIYTEFADCILSNKKTNHTFPNIEDGVKGIKFIFAAKKSSNNNSKWEKI